MTTLSTLEGLFAGHECFGGLDLSATTDVTSYVHVTVTGDLVHLLPYFWLPGDGLRERSMRDGVPYQQWVQQGYIELTPGNVVDYRYITHKIIDDLSKRFNIRQIAFDRWGAAQVYQEFGLTSSMHARR